MDMKKNPLDEIDGVGPGRKRALLHAFGSARGVSRASVEDLAKIDGVSEALAQRLGHRIACLVGAGLLAAALAGAQPRIVVAVTGTNGKTSTVEFLRQLWTLAGGRAASLGTLGLVAPGFPQGAGLTTPDPVTLAETLAALARAGVERAAMEASSHGLDQFRLDGVRLAAAGFTNLTRDHLDYHGSLAAYRAAKLRLFAELLPPGAPAVSSDALDAETRAGLAELARARRLDLRTVGEAGGFLRLLRATPLPDGQEIEIAHAGARRTVTLALPGRFQADNVLLAAALALATGLADALDLLPRLQGVRGRMELAARLPNGAAAYVDYAHTPDALERLRAGAFDLHVRERLWAIEPGRAWIRPVHAGTERAFAADAVVFASGNRSNRGLYDQLQGHSSIVAHLVGDALSARTIEQAMAEGRRVGASI
jgi:UDP-N-acetylmuramyl tripeptide synthase